MIKPADFDINKNIRAFWKFTVLKAPSARSSAMKCRSSQPTATVFYCNPRGSDSRGNAFAISGRFGKEDYSDLMAFYRRCPRALSAAGRQPLRCHRQQTTAVYEQLDHHPDRSLQSGNPGSIHFQLRHQVLMHGYRLHLQYGQPGRNALV